MDKPQYRKNPIGHVSSLAKFLSIDQNQIMSLAEKANSSYHIHERIEKANGSLREIYSVKYELKSLQQKITNKIYSNVDFPYYLYAVKDRNHIQAVEAHANASLLVKMDISNFFPSLKSKVIFDIWKRFFNFPEPVAELLTTLTTFNGFLPQGAPTSPGLANLAFWDTEPTVVEKLSNLGFRYTRYVDDISVSTERHIAVKNLSPIFESIFGMFSCKGVKPNRNKINIMTSGHRMSVHNLNINAGNPTIPKRERSRIRAAVKQCEDNYIKDSLSHTYRELWDSTIGRVNYLHLLHPNEAQGYIERLETIRPKSLNLTV